MYQVAVAYHERCVLEDGGRFDFDVLFADGIKLKEIYLSEPLINYKKVKI